MPDVIANIFFCRYHPYKPLRRHKLEEGDFALRLTFCQWLITLTDEELLEFLFSDEAMFLLSGHVNSQNIRRYAELKSSNPETGGRPEHFVHEKPTFSKKVMVFLGCHRDGTWGLKFYHEETMDGDKYHSLLQYHALPQIREWNGGNLDR